MNDLNILQAIKLMTAINIAVVINNPIKIIETDMFLITYCAN